jgi:hypothetical protein
VSRTDPKPLLELTDWGARPSWNPDPDPTSRGETLMTPRRPVGNGTVEHAQAGPLVALTAGYQSAFEALTVLAGIGLTLALLLLGQSRKTRQAHPQPAPAPST